MPLTGGTEVTFADRKTVVDDLYLAPIAKVTNGHPERFPFSDVMNLVSNYWAKDRVKQVSNAMIRDHLAQFGSE